MDPTASVGRALPVEESGEAGWVG